MYRIGIVGCGRISRQHFKACQQLEARAKVVAACDIDRTLLDARCDEFDIALRFEDVNALANSGEIDVAIIITPPNIRMPVIRPLLEAGKHLLVEKPFTESMQEARDIVTLAEKHSIHVAVNQNYRWFAATLHIRDLIQQGRIGKPTYAIINDCVWRDEVSGWRRDTNRLALAVMGVHWLDRLRWLLDDKPSAVTCVTAARPTLESGGENETTSIIEFTNGAMATLTHSWSSHTHGATNFQQFDGLQGSLTLYNETDITLFSGEAKENWNLARDFTASFGGSVTRLLEAIDRNEEAPHSAKDNLITMNLLEACYLSASDQRRVEIVPDEMEVS